MKKVIALFVILGALMTFNSCDLDDDQPNFHFTTLSVVEAQVPDSFVLNEVYDIEVTYIRPDECTFFEGFDVAKTGETDRDVVVIGSVLTDQQFCAQVIEEVTATFQFNVIFTGEYRFRFYAGQDENDSAVYLEYTVPVEVPPTN